MKNNNNNIRKIFIHTLVKCTYVERYLLSGEGICFTRRPLKKKEKEKKKEREKENTLIADFVVKYTLRKQRKRRI